MFEYQWGTQSTGMLPGNDHVSNDSSSDYHHQNFYDHHYFTDPTQLIYPTQFPNPEAQLGALHDPRASYESYTLDPTQYSVIPKPEPDIVTCIGLNLEGRTYFSSTQSQFVNRLYLRSEERAVNVPRCQAEGCGADLTHAKHYHRRHKTCEFHSKAAAVVAAGLTQRFCQQCSRFHLLTEFDNEKRSCRKRLAHHNQRRRKSNKTTINQKNKQTPKSHNEISLTDLPSSPQNSGSQSTSSVTLAISPARIPLDYYQQRSY